MKYLICLILLLPNSAWGLSPALSLLKRTLQEQDPQKKINLYTRAIKAWKPSDKKRSKILAYYGRAEAYLIIAEYEKARKDCEDRLKQAFISKEKGLLVASEDGEELELPTVSYRKSSVVIKAKK